MHARPIRTLALSLLAIMLLAGCGGADGVVDDERTAARDAASSQAEHDAEPAPDPDAATSPIPRDVPQATADLEVVMEEVGGKDGAGIPVPEGMRCTRSIPATCRAAISCPVAAEDSPAADVCRWLTVEGAELLAAPADPGGVCTQQYGGPERLTVTGTVNDERLGGDDDSPRAQPAFTATRTNGCQIARFDSVAPLYTGAVTKLSASSDGAVDDPGDVIVDPDAPVSNTPQPDVIDDPPEIFAD